MDKRLIAGPWVGEFGWELFAWQAYVRALSYHYDKTYIICRENSQYLYKDFAHEFIFKSPVGNWSDSYFMHNVDAGSLLKECLRENRNLIDENTSVFLPRRIGNPPLTSPAQTIHLAGREIMPKYISYGKSTLREYNYIFHMRNRKLRAEDNWSADNWKKLRDLFLRDGKSIACIGTMGESLCIEGVADLRGISLELICNVLKNAECIFGPSSGPIHLASLCECPHFVWSKPANKDRYLNTWNPLSTPVRFDSKYLWHPPPEYVYSEYKKWIKN